MSNLLAVMCVVIFAFAAGIGVGYADGHRIVAKECERLGAFYVGAVTYSCAPKEALAKGER